MPRGVCLQGVCIQGGLHWGGWSASRGVCLSGVGQTPLRSAYGGSLYPWDWADSPPSDTWDTTRYGQQADGTHPTVMLSCFYNSFYINDTTIHMRLFYTNEFHLFYFGEFTNLMLIQIFQCMFQILLNIHNDNLNYYLYFVSKTIPGRHV